MNLRMSGTYERVVMFTVANNTDTINKTNDKNAMVKHVFASLPLVSKGRSPNMTVRGMELTNAPRTAMLIQMDSIRLRRSSVSSVR